MYSKDRSRNKRELHLNETSRANLSTLINDPGTSHIIISGEGEPFNNYPTLMELLALSKGDRYYQIITHGNWNGKNIYPQLAELHEHAKQHGDRYSMRFSFDSDHITQVGNERYKEILYVASQLNSHMLNVIIALRSLIEEKQQVRNTLRNYLHEMNISFKMIPESELDDAIVFPNGATVNVNYKNIVNPGKLYGRKAFPMIEYIESLERKYGKQFTFGNMAAKRAPNGLDLTVKPEGDVLFYGIEIQSFENIFQGKLDMKYYQDTVRNNPILHLLYTIPFKDILRRLSQNPKLAKELTDINNPFWVVKKFWREHRSELEHALQLK